MSHTTQEDLQKKIDEALQLVQVGAQYVHFKDSEKKYIVEYVGILENSEEVCVGYRALYGEGILWVRTLTNFLAEKEVDGEKVKRFKRV